MDNDGNYQVMDVNNSPAIQESTSDNYGYQVFRWYLSYTHAVDKYGGRNEPVG